MWHPFETTHGGYTVCRFHGQFNPMGARLAAGILQTKHQAELLAMGLNRHEAWAFEELSSDQRRRYV